MQSFSHKVEDLGYTEMAYSDFFSIQGMEYPSRIELALNVSKLEMGIHDGSVLGVMLERFIDDVNIGDVPFETVYLNENEEPSQWLQTMIKEEDEEFMVGNRFRFRYFLSQANPNGTPSKASFAVAVNVK